MSGPGRGFLARLHRVEQRLADQAESPPGPGLTEPDAPTGERWDWGQVWAHLAEFVPYWAGQVRMILTRPPAEDPVEFGRVKSDPIRVSAIQADRFQPPAELHARLVKQLDELRQLLDEMTGADWQRQGAHSTLGTMDMTRIVNEFLVGHLEAHADQLDGLAASRRGSIRPTLA